MQRRPAATEPKAAALQRERAKAAPAPALSLVPHAPHALVPSLAQHLRLHRLGKVGCSLGTYRVAAWVEREAASAASPADLDMPISSLPAYLLPPYDLSA